MIGMALNQTFVPRNYDVFVGLDVDKNSLSVTVVDHMTLTRSLRMPCLSDNLLGYIHKHFPSQKVAFAYEAGPTGFGLYDDLTAAGHSCLVAAPSMIPTAPGQRVKTNRLDSKKIAESLRGGQLKSIHVPSLSYRHLRHLIQLRDTFVRQSTAFKNRIKSLLLYERIPFPAAASQNQWSLRVMSELNQLSCAGPVRFKLDRLLSSLRFAQEQVHQTTREIHRFCQEDPEIARCMGYLISIPGIGAIIASHLLARIGDWRQLSNVRQLGAFLGLTPREDSTGDEVSRGSITVIGDERLRNKLIQGAWVATRRDPELKEFFDRVYRSHTQEAADLVAIVAVARKLTTRIYAVLKEQRKYEVRCN
jgi:transposase